jgi:hypothetical protein
LTLTETGANTGIFEASMPFVVASVTPGDSMVQVMEGQSITVTYDDADDGTGSPATVMDTATINCADYFTELFGAGFNDLSNFTLMFTPDGSGNFYKACATPTTVFPTDPAGGNTLSLTDDSSLEVSSGLTVSLYGVDYTSFYVGSNGYITFGSGDTTYSEGLANHFSVPRVAGLFDDLNPTLGGSVSWRALADRVAITFDDISEYGTSNSNNFQFELFTDGRIAITYLAIAATDGLSGISEGVGVPADFEASDISKYGPCVLSNAWVDFAWNGAEAGTMSSPFNTLQEAVDTLVGDGTGIVNVKGDTADSSSPETITINKPMTIQAVGGPVQIGVP